MADFARALPFVLRNEGGKCDVPGDSGGRTNAGVSTPALADFNAKHPELGFPMDPWALTDDQITQFYHLGYWRFDGLRDQACATKILDMDVNMGPGEGIKLAQVAANRCGLRLVVDGGYGLATEAGLNSLDPARLMHALVMVSLQHYAAIVAAKPNDQKFIDGWSRRAQEVPE